MITFMQVVMIVFGVGSIGEMYDLLAKKQNTAGGVLLAVLGVVLLAGAVALEVFVKR